MLNMLDRILSALFLLLNPHLYWETAYEIGYEIGRRHARGKVGDAAEKRRVIARWGQKRASLMTPVSAGRTALLAQARYFRYRPRLTWDTAYAVGYDEGYGDTIVGSVVKSDKWQENFEAGFREGWEEAQRAWEGWNSRRLAAECAGQPFTEPTPSRNRIPS